MRIERAFTTAGRSPYEAIGFRTACSEIRNPDGSVVFRLDDIEVPSAWSQVAVDVLAQKYFRKAGVPRRLARALQLRERGPVLIACPTCGRLQFDMDTVVAEIEQRLES